jgi:hypothetical protein
MAREYPVHSLSEARENRAAFACERMDAARKELEQERVDRFWGAFVIAAMLAWCALVGAIIWWLPD